MLITGSTTRNFILKIPAVKLTLCLNVLGLYILTGVTAIANDSNTEGVIDSGDGIALTITTQEARNADSLNQLFEKAAADSTSFSSIDAAKNWLQDMSDRIAFRIKDPVYRIELLTLVHEHARASGLDPQIVLSVIEIESSFNRFAVSKSGARGLMQIMPFWIKEIGHPRDNLFHPATNLWYGCYILRHYLDRSDGNLGMALRRYNGGGDDRYSNKVLAAFQKRWLLAN